MKSLHFAAVLIAASICIATVAIADLWSDGEIAGDGYMVPVGLIVSAAGGAVQGEKQSEGTNTSEQ